MAVEMLGRKRLSPFSVIIDARALPMDIIMCGILKYGSDEPQEPRMRSTTRDLVVQVLFDQGHHTILA
jgi:hypothetical protein